MKPLLPSGYSRTWLLALLVAALSGMARGDGPALPQWNGPQDAAPLGGGLWPQDFQPDSVVHPAAPAGPGTGDAAANDETSWMRFLPRSLFDGATNPAGASPVTLEEITAEVLRACDRAPADTRLLDPEGILTGAQGEDMARFLTFHGERSATAAYLLMLDANQKLPPNADLMHIASDSLSGRAACFVVYPFGAPARARVFLTKSTGVGADTADLHRLSAACIRDAVEVKDPFEQLQRFAMQLSVRLSWLERAYPAVTIRPAIKVTPSASSAHPPPPETLKEVTTAPAGSTGDSKLTLWWRQWQRIIYLLIAVLAVLGTGFYFLQRWHRRRLRQTIWILPEYDHRHAVRFGGPHCGGGGASVKYG